MYCGKCGKSVEDGAKKCTACGYEFQNNETEASVNEIKEKVINGTQKIENKKLIKYLGLGGGVLAAIVTAVLIIVSATSKVSLKNYMSDDLTYTGINGYGTAELYDIIDYESLNQVIMKKDLKEEDYYNYYFNEADISDYITYECVSGNNGKLSNGDEIEIKVSINKAGIKNNKLFGKNISGGETQTFKYKVKGLEEGTAIDVFDAVDYVSYDATSYGDSTIVLKENYIYDYKTNGINVKVENEAIKVYGDDFNSFSVSLAIASDNFDENSKTVKLKINSDESLYHEYGIVFSELTKDLPLKTISYVTSDKINAEDLKILTGRAKEYVNKEAEGEKATLVSASLFVDSESPDSYLTYFFKNSKGKFYGIYFDYIKQTSDGRIYNLDNLEADDSGWFGLKEYENIQEFKDMHKHDKEYSIAVS